MTLLADLFRDPSGILFLFVAVVLIGIPLVVAAVVMRGAKQAR